MHLSLISVYLISILSLSRQQTQYLGRTSAKAQDVIDDLRLTSPTPMLSAFTIESPLTTSLLWRGNCQQRMSAACTTETICSAISVQDPSHGLFTPLQARWLHKLTARLNRFLSDSSCLMNTFPLLLYSSWTHLWTSPTYPAFCVPSP